MKQLTVWRHPEAGCLGKPWQVYLEELVRRRSDKGQKCLIVKYPRKNLIALALR